MSNHCKQFYYSFNPFTNSPNLSIFSLFPLLNSRCSKSLCFIFRSMAVRRLFAISFNALRLVKLAILFLSCPKIHIDFISIMSYK